MFNVGVGQIGFFFATWDEYHTKVLNLGYINGPVEGIIVGVLTHMYAAIYCINIK